MNYFFSINRLIKPTFALLLIFLIQIQNIKSFLTSYNKTTNTHENNYITLPPAPPLF